jgi:colicin import membrane protein
MQKTGAEVPEYGTIQQRQAVDIFEYVDPKGRKPVAYTKIMKKYKITEEQVLTEACKFNIIINSQHFVVPENEGVKRGRPSTKKEPKAKGVKGRPKKEKKVLQVEGDDEDLFATLVAEANEDSEQNADALGELTLASKSTTQKKAGRNAGALGKSDEEKEAERLAKEAEKEAKRIAAENAKKEKEAKLAAEKAEKEAKKAAEKAEKEAKKEEEDEEPDVVKKVEFEGKKYLKSKKTGIIYDYNEYVKNGEQLVVGKWNDKTNKIDFADAEEEEEEYDM